MNNKHTEIDDNEIRVISFDNKYDTSRRRPKRLKLVISLITAILLAGVAIFFLLPADETADYEEIPVQHQSTMPTPDEETGTTDAKERGYTQAADTVINGTELLILSPENAEPTLAIGQDVLSDTSAVLVAQAADVRGDNGQIGGTYVLKGELISKGEAKAGFCSIINGKLSIGVADATPMLEQALTTGGYFFRQYPLVVGGQIVENKPKGRALRKALAEIDGKICIVASKKRLTFHDFSQSLIDAGARNAIYLVGANSSGFYINSLGENIPLGTNSPTPYENTNYIVWR